MFLSLPVISAEGPVAWWKFEQAKEDKVVETVGGGEDAVVGFYKLVKGVSGSALKLDGLTSYIVCESVKAPKISGALSVEAWVALGAYPLNWTTIAGQYEGEKSGYFFGISDKGEVGLQIFEEGSAKKIASDSKLGLRKWHHIAGIFDPAVGLVIYIDGKEAATLETEGKFGRAEKPLFIGKYAEKVKPTGGIRKNSHMVTDIFYDGIIDELKIFDRALTAEEIAKGYKKNKPVKAPDILMRVLPSGPKGEGSFGAFYTQLKYYEEWDNLWRVSDYPDIVVRFDKAPYRFIFWRGTSYIPHWVTENGIWYDNEFTETWGHGAVGCAEPMSDKQCRHSHVRIIESNNARTVVHWRYALVDNSYNFSRVDGRTGWGDWTDEIYTIWPDGVAVREITLHSTAPADPHEWHEGIMVLGPGQRPESILETEAITLANIDGKTHNYSWAESAPKSMKEPQNPCIHLVNTKSKYKPFVIVSPASKPRVSAYRGEIRRDVSIFPWWNHWPTSQNPSDGRWAMAADRAAHSSLTHIKWNAYSQTKNTMTKIMLNGMTDKKAGELALLARSWADPARLEVAGRGFVSEGYDPTERAYIIRAQKTTGDLEFTVAASEEHPVINLPLVVKNWGRRRASLSIDGNWIHSGDDFRSDLVDKLEETDLVVWVKIESITPLKVTINSPQRRRR
jgi:hypothetical protein